MRIVLLVCLCCYYALASGFKISEQSLNATALSSAYVAGAFGADSAYYNPANMGFTHQLSSNDKSELELTLTGIYIPGFSFTTDTGRKDIGQGSINWGLSTETTLGVPDNMANLANTFLGVDLKAPIKVDSEEKNQHGTYGFSEKGALVEGSADPTFFPVPKVFYKSKTAKSSFGNWNYGVSFTAPSGLAMNWNGEAGAFLRNVMIAMVEFSPSLSWNYEERISIGVSPRILYGMGNFQNTVFVPLGTPQKPGKVETNLQDFDEIPPSMIPEAMGELIYAVNTAQGNALAALAGVGIGGGKHLDNKLRYNLPTLFNPEAWFGMPDPSVFDEFINEDKKSIDVAGYNAKVEEINATIKQNWEHYKESKASGAMTWGYEEGGYNPNGQSKGIDHINACILTSDVNPLKVGCSDIPDDIYWGQKGYINCYTGTHNNFDGSLQSGFPGVCTDPTPTETDENGVPRGYATLMDAKELSEKFGMGDMNITTNLIGATKVDQKSKGADFAFGYKAAVSVRPFESKKTTLSFVYTSPVTFNLKGDLDATTYIGGSMGNVNMKADLNLAVTLPSSMQIAIMHNFGRLGVEFVYEKIYWSKGDKFAFNFSNPRFTPLSGMVMQFSPEQLSGMMDLADYGAVAMGDGWNDTTALRLGLSYLTKKNYFLMGSFAFDQSPVPQDKLGIPDSNAYMFGFGVRKQTSDKWNIGLAYSLSLKDGRKSIYQTGGFGQLHLFSASIGYTF
nr:outer membrane protein transport protein [uncultured Helicobacter sp.]